MVTLANHRPRAPITDVILSIEPTCVNAQVEAPALPIRLAVTDIAHAIAALAARSFYRHLA